MDRIVFYECLHAVLCNIAYIRGSAGHIMSRLIYREQSYFLLSYDNCSWRDSDIFAWVWHCSQRGACSGCPLCDTLITILVMTQYNAALKTASNIQ